MCSAKGHVRFAPESRHVQRTSRCPLSANSGQGSAKRVAPPTSAGRRKDHEKGTAPALTEGEHDACGSAHVLATDRKRRSTGSDCTSHDCRRSRSADILRLSDTRSSTAYHRRPSQSPRTMEPRSSLLPLAVGQRLEKQERQPRKPCGPSSTSLVGACNNTEQPVSIARRRLRKSKSLGQKQTCAAHKPMSALCQERTCAAREIEAIFVLYSSRRHIS